MTAEALAKTTGDPKKQVPMAEYHKHTNHEEIVQSIKEGNPIPPERETSYVSIDRDRWVQIRGAHDAANGLLRTLRNHEKVSKPKYINVSVGGDKKQNGERTLTAHYNIIVYSDGQKEQPEISYEEFKEIVPATADGTAGEGDNKERVENVPVEIQKTRSEKTNYFDDNYRPVPGGCQMTSNGSRGTTATPAYDSGYYVMTTAGHVPKSSGQDVNQPTAGNKIGVSDKVVDQVYRDYATIDMTDADVDYEIVGGDYDDPPAKNVEAYGVVSWDKITMEEGNSLYEVQRQGSTNGRNAGSITDTFPDYRGIKLDVPSDGGDSGGTLFHIDNDTALIVGIMDRASGNYTYGNAMVEVEDDLNISV